MSLSSCMCALIKLRAPSAFFSASSQFADPYLCVRGEDFVSALPYQDARRAEHVPRTKRASEDTCCFSLGAGVNIHIGIFIAACTLTSRFGLASTAVE
jgi:hypothetical protein